MNKNGRACHPRYLQAGLLMMALNNQSSRQAVMDMFIMDTVVYKRERKLPIRLRKDYQRQLQFLKKYASMSDTNGKENDIITQIGPGSINLLNKDSTQNDNVTEQCTGDAYNFGDNPNSSELVTANLTSKQLKNAPTHSKDVENLFGVEDSILTRFGPQAFEKSSDDLVIKYGYDLMPKNPKVFCSAKARRLAKDMKKAQNDFNAKQAALIEAGVAVTDADILSKDNQLQKIVQSCVQL
ncbi:MAG: hypothetical protein QF782_02800 [Porticoccaceae bacterium]|nr:hypothetical protein [Porticoccaceae bacterium]